MDEPQQRKRLIKDKLDEQNNNSSNVALSSKRTRLIENQDNAPSSILNLGRFSLLPPPAPIARPIANTFSQTRYANVRDHLEGSDSESEFSKCFARINV